MTRVAEVGFGSIEPGKTAKSLVFRKKQQEEMSQTCKAFVDNKKWIKNVIRAWELLWVIRQKVGHIEFWLEWMWWIQGFDCVRLILSCWFQKYMIVISIAVIYNICEMPQRQQLCWCYVMRGPSLVSSFAKFGISMPKLLGVPIFLPLRRVEMKLWATKIPHML